MHRYDWSRDECSHSGHFWLDVRHLVSASGDNSEFVIQDLAIGEGQGLSNFFDRGFHVKGLSRKGGVWVILGNVEGDPFASLLSIESEDSQRGGEVSPGGEGTAMNTSDASAIAVELSRIVVLEDDVTDVGVVTILNLLRDVVTVNSENVLGVTDLDDSVWVELALERVRVVLLIDSLDAQESLLDIIDIVLTLLRVWHSEVVHSLLQCVHLSEFKFKRRI